jgi:N-acetyl-anhydromuramyl-L-alanine amidase AmpD
MRRHHRIMKRAIPFAFVCLLFGSALSTPYIRANENYVAHAEGSRNNSLQDAFSSAAKEFGVPESLLMSVSYNLTRWEHHDGLPSTSAGYSVMHLTDYELRSNQDPNLHTLAAASKLLHLTPEVLKSDPAQNIRGAAALLAQYAQETTGTVPDNPEDWYGAVVKYSGSADESTAFDFANLVYQTMNLGTERQTSNGQYVHLSAQWVKPNENTAKSLHLKTYKRNGADCPRGLSCRFIPAAHQQLSDDPGDYSNYDVADRPHFGPEIRYILLHDTEVNYAGTIDIFQDPYSFVAAHYVIRSSDGEVAQMVKNKDVGWHAGNWYFNMHTIGIEHEGYAMEGAAWYNEYLYRASARLVKYLARKYGIPMDRAHIFGHEEVPGLSKDNQKQMHRDPGPFWDWEHYMELLGAPNTPRRGSTKLITINPHFQTNQPPLSDAPSQPSNFVYLYKMPSFNAELLDDAATIGEDKLNALAWGDKAVSGQSYYWADHNGDWDAIWYGGQKAWFYNPNGRNAAKTSGMIIKPKAGKDTIPVYGGAFPEAGAYPSGIGPHTLSPLQYTIQQGQKYAAFEKVRGDYYNAVVFAENPYAYAKEVVGNEEYYRIQFNHRFAFVKASDVETETN